MIDREKVIMGLEFCTKGNFCVSDCPYFKEMSMTDGRCITAVQTDALALLKEQEAVHADTKKKVLADRQCEVSPHHYERKGFCPKCHQEVKFILNRNYCGFCGQAVKWNADGA